MDANLSENVIDLANSVVVQSATRPGSKSVYAKLAKAMPLIHGLEKNGYNDYQEYHYVTSEDVVAETRKALIDVGLVFFPAVIRMEKIGNRSIVTMLFTLVDSESGETLATLWVGEGEDKGDKGINKAITAATKYYFMKLFLIPDANEPDADADAEKKTTGAKKSTGGASKKAERTPTKTEYESACKVLFKGEQIGGMTEEALNVLLSDKEGAKLKSPIDTILAWRKEHTS